MSQDRELEVRLTGDASDLTAATREGAAGLRDLAGAGKQATTETGKSAAVDAEAAASKRALGEAARQAADAEKRAGAEAKRVIDDARRAEATALRAATAEANQLKQAYRQLGPQITDVVTSVASGQPIWMVAIQQGGQIKDSFGGIGKAASALAGMVKPAYVAIGAGAAVVTVLTLAYNQGAAESQAYARAIILSGNAAGTTRGQLQGMARDIDAAGSTQAKAAEALTAATATGRVAAANLQLVATTATEMERVLGVAIADTVAEFAELGRAPLQASVKLNETYRHLTVATYDQIRALTEQGRVAEASAVAQKALADAINPRLKDVENNLGALETAWRKVGKVAAEAWDGMLGIGRQKSLEDQLKQAEAALASPVRRGGNAIEVEKGRAALRARVDELRAQIYAEREAAAAQAASTEATDKHIREADKRDQEALARADAAVQRVKAQQAAMVGAYADAQRLLDATRGDSALSEREYYAAKLAFIELDRDAQLRALADESRILAGKKALGADAIRRDTEIAQNKAEAARITAKASADIAIANAQEASSLTALSRAQSEYWLQLQRTNDARATGNDRTLKGFGRGDQAREQMGREAAITDQFNGARQRLDDDRNGGRISQGAYQERLAALRAYYGQALELEAQFQADRQRLEGDASQGFTRALENYLASARNVAAQTERMWSGAFQGMEDAIVSFVTTGKADFKSLANSIIADLIRIYVRQQMISFLATAFGGGGGGAGAAGAVNGSAGTTFIPANVGHTGGVVGREPMDGWRMMPAAMFDRAPRLHGGRLGKGEYAAVLKEEESVLTPAQMRQLAPAGSRQVMQPQLNLTVINQTGQAAEVKTRQRSDGGIEVLLTAVKQSIAGDISSGSGEVTQALQGRFGLKPSFST